MASEQVDTDENKIVQTARLVVQREASAVAGLADPIGQDFAELVKRILAIPGKVITTGTGTSAMTAERLAHLLAVSGTPAFYLPCLDALHGGRGAITATDLVIALSEGGQSGILTQLVTRLGRTPHPRGGRHRGTGLAFRGGGRHRRGHGDQPPEADLGGLIAAGSPLVAGAWGEALAATVMASRAYSGDDVIATHPGGIVGN